MCDFENGFILCSCKTEIKKTVHKNDKSKVQREYLWVLSRFIGHYESFMEGEYEMPSKDLGAGLNSEWVLLNLNLGECFDFEYIPEEGDNLSFRLKDKFEFMSFIYKKGNWIEELYDPFSTTLELKSSGKIKEID